VRSARARDLIGAPSRNTPERSSCPYHAPARTRRGAEHAGTVYSCPTALLRTLLRMLPSTCCSILRPLHPLLRRQLNVLFLLSLLHLLLRCPLQVQRDVVINNLSWRQLNVLFLLSLLHLLCAALCKSNATWSSTTYRGAS
jgi:hypothetical protein